MSLSTESASPTDSVLIIGGGLAGLATAVGLAEQGVGSTILESRPRLGGRASSFHDAATDQWVDNCQHVTMGCCTNFRAFCETTGLADSFRREEVLYFVAPNGAVNPFRASSLPVPLHLAVAFAGLSYLTWSDKLALGRGLRQLAARPATGPEESFADWISKQRQPQRVVDRFWKVVLVSALSESLDRIGVNEARKVLVDGFLAHRDAWKVDIPRRPLEELYGTRLMSWLSQHGIEVQFLTAGDQVHAGNGSVTGVTLRDGRRVGAEDYVVAVPHQRLLGLLPAELQQVSEFAGVSQLETAPISSVHLWFDRPITPLPHAVFVEGLVQWVFNRTALSEQPPTDETGWYVQVVISASRELLGQDSDAIRDQVLAELSVAFPETRVARLIRSRQVTEHRAVFSPLPGSQAHRPPQQSPLPNLQLAGDYTQTGWPATMEGAVRSGFLAAENILRRRGRPATLLRPDLPVARLSRWMFG